MKGYLQFVGMSMLGVVYAFAALFLAYAIGTFGIAAYLGLNNYWAFVFNMILFVLFMSPAWLMTRPRKS